MRDRIRSLAATFAARLVIIAIVALAAGGMYYMPSHDLRGLIVPVYIGTAGVACGAVALCCDLLDAWERVMAEDEPRSITEIVGERPR